MITSENYREIYEELVEETEDFTSESGVVKCTTKKASDIIREILSNYYNIIDYGISDIEEVDGNVYMVIYNDRNDEELSFEEEEPFDEPEEIEEVPDDVELPEDEDTVQESLSLVEGYLTEGIEESKSFVSEALKQHPEFRELIKAGAWEELQEQVYKYYPQDDIKSESAWGKFLEVLDKSGVKYKIDSIPEYCFRNSDITSFKIPEGTTKIGMCAFERCYNLTSIEIPDSVTDINFRAFWSCTSLTEIKLPASLEIIGSEVFRNCKNWKGDVVIPDTCHSIMGAAFMKCASLDSVTIPKSVTHIGPDCFKECNLKSITLPTKYKYDIKGLGLSGMPRKSIIITESLVEKIVKKGSKWQVQSEKGRNMGTYDTKEKAKERLRQVEYFKHKNESIDDDFKLHHSLKEDIPTFWEWVDDQGLDPDVVEENPDLEEYFRQQYDITFNFKSPEDYDLSDTDIPDDDFQQEEEPLGYHFVCYYEDDDSPGDQTGDTETLEDAIKMCKGYIDKYNYDNAEIFGPNGDTAATFYKGEWNTFYSENINDMDLEEIEEINLNVSLCKDNYTGKYYIIDNTNQEILDGGTTSLEKAKQMVDDAKEYLSFGESLDETLSGLKSKKKLDILRELKKDPNYKEDPRWKQFEDELINFYRVDPSEADIDTAIYYTETDWIDAQHQMESLEGDKLKFSPNYNPEGTPIGKGTCLGEELDEEEPSLECLNCGCDTEWLGTQGDLEEFKCPECGEYYYLTKDGRVVGEEAFRESLNEGARSGIHQMTLRLMLLNELKKNPDYKNDPRWEEFSDIYDNIDAAIKDTNDELRDLRYDRKWESLDSKKKLTEAIVNGAFTPETFDKVLRSAELSSDLSDDEFTDKLCDVIYDELRIANSPELRHWEDGYYDCLQAYEELLTEEGRQAVTEFVSKHLFVPGDKRATNNNRSKDELESGTTLTGVDTEGEQIYIGIDDKVYMFEEDPDDGYRSYMGDPKIVSWDLNNKFDSVEVKIVRFRDDGRVSPKLLSGKGIRFEGYEIYDAKNKKPILLIGTDYSDDYYPTAIFEWHPEDMSINESLTEALIDRDMDTIKRSDLSKAPMGSVLKLKFNERPNNNWIDAYVKLDTDDWAVLDDAGEIDGDYNLLDSQRLYFSLMNFDEMTEFEIDTAPNKKYNFNLTEAVIDFYNNNIKKQYSRFCDIYERAFEKIPDLKIKVINRSYVAEKTINSSDASASIGILGGDSDGTFFELRLDPEASDSFATFYIDKDGNVSVESTIYGNIVELCHLFDKKKDRLIDLITPLFDGAYDKLSEAIKNAGFKLGESLTEAKGRKFKVTGTLRNIWHDDNGNEVDREEWEETHTYTIDSNDLPSEDLAKVKFEDGVTRYWDKRIRHDDGSEFEVEVTSVEPLGESLTEAKNDTLNPAIWENNELKPEVKEKLELIVDKFKERLKEDGVDIDIDDVIIVGSNANYNYTDKSDIDLHLVADLSIYKDKEDLAQVVYNAYRRLFNDKFDPMIYGHEVELYIEPKE